MKLASLVLAGIALATACGCTHVQLRNNTVNESSAIGDVMVQEVMNNLAMFVYNPNSMPFFSVPNQGSAQVTDMGQLQVNGQFSRPITSSGSKDFLQFIFTQLQLNGQASRSMQDGLTLTPVLDPRKLELMRCAYQKAVSSCGCGRMSQNCPDCDSRFNTFYTGDPDGDIKRAVVAGTVTSECLAGQNGPCWFHVGNEKCVPKKCECLYVGCYCGVYVWVDRDGRDELTKLTLAILDFAQNNPPVPLTKSVSYNIDQFGLPASSSDSVGQVSATVTVDEQPASLLNIPQDQAARIEQILLARQKADQDTIRANQNTADVQAAQTDLLLIQKKLDFLRQVIQAGPLKRQYLPGAQQQVPNGLLQLQLYNNALLPPSH